LLTAFRATLEEVQEAALILHVSDVSNPHHAELDDAVNKILNDLGVGDRPKLRVFNKVDRLTPEERGPLVHPCALGAGIDGGPVLVSALNGEGIEELLRRIDDAVPIDPVVTLSLRLPLAEGRTLALVHALGRVLRSEVEDSHMLLDAEVPASIARRLRLASFAPKETLRTTPT
jgi:GTP-binding protein HflX